MGQISRQADFSRARVMGGGGGPGRAQGRTRQVVFALSKKIKIEKEKRSFFP